MKRIISKTAAVSILSALITSPFAWVMGSTQKKTGADSTFYSVRHSAPVQNLCCHPFGFLPIDFLSKIFFFSFVVNFINRLLLRLVLFFILTRCLFTRLLLVISDWELFLYSNFSLDVVFRNRENFLVSLISFKIVHLILVSFPAFLNFMEIF